MKKTLSEIVEIVTNAAKEIEISMKAGGDEDFAKLMIEVTPQFTSVFAEIRGVKGVRSLNVPFVVVKQQAHSDEIELKVNAGHMEEFMTAVEARRFRKCFTVADTLAERLDYLTYGSGPETV